VSAPDWDTVHASERAARSDVPWLDIDLTANDIYRDGVPYELFRTLREEHPVWRHPTMPTNRSPEGVGEL
jgi:hypothetical protein